VVLETHAPDWKRLGELRFPLIVKPDFHDRWLDDPRFRAAHGSQKALLLHDAAQAERLLPDLLRFGDLIVQEYVPGPSEQLYYYVGYRSASGRQLVSFVGRKRRTYPEGLGTETLLESVREDAVARLGDAVLERIGGRGVAGVDCKFDARDGTFRVIEANWRFGTSDGLLAACGVDLPWIVYQDLCGESAEVPALYPTGVFWSWLERDVDWMRDAGGGAGAWLRWLVALLRTRPRGIVFSWRDPLPFLHEARRVLRRLAGGVTRRRS
jgi:predicted ATP-grasp superfamily ATP-dependent carboligase